MLITIISIFEPRLSAYQFSDRHRDIIGSDVIKTIFTGLAARLLTMHGAGGAKNIAGDYPGPGKGRRKAETGTGRPENRGDPDSNGIREMH